MPQNMNDRRRRVVLLTRDVELERTVLAAGAAVGRVVDVVGASNLVGHAWGDAGSLLVGCDLAAEVIDLALPRRPGVFVLGTATDRAAACDWSMPLGAAVLLLPEGSRWLSSVISGAVTPEADPVVVIGVLGGSGGVGASTHAVGLALSAVRMKRRVALVDVDISGGGIDLLLGAEDLPGWRWSRLRTARGQIGDLRGKVPAVDGVDLVTMSRGEQTDVGRDALAAVVSSLSRTHEVVVLDIGRGLGAGALEAVRVSDRLVLACGQDVRSVASSRTLLATAAASGVTGAVVRQRAGASVSPGAVADSLGLPLWGVLPHDPALASAADRGVSPGSKRWTAACDDVLAKLAPGPGAVPGRARRGKRWWRP